jgi:glycosyltransferase involved in cell wall biosynthesis
MKTAARPTDFFRAPDRLPDQDPTDGAATSRENAPPPLRVSIVLAAYNEEAVISENLQQICAQLDKHSRSAWELVCINDGSTDKTGVLLEQFAAAHASVRVLHHRRNFGQGRALRAGFDLCTGDIIVTMDADLSYGPEWIVKLAQIIETEPVDIALASAYMRGGTVSNVPLLRHVLSRVANLYLAQGCGFPVATSTCVMRAYRRDVIDSLVLQADGPDLQLEILMKASMLGFSVREVPAHLDWHAKSATGAGRTSKMRIQRTIGRFLFMGWISRPAFAFFVMAALALIPSIFMAVALGYRICQRVAAHLAEGLAQACSIGLQDVYLQHTYSVIFCGTGMLVGLQLLGISMLLLQHKYHFEELYKLGQFQIQRDRRSDKRS